MHIAKTTNVNPKRPIPVKVYNPTEFHVGHIIKLSWNEFWVRIDNTEQKYRNTRCYNVSPASFLRPPGPLSSTCCEWSGKACLSCSSGQTCKAAPPACLQIPPSSSFCKLYSSQLKIVFLPTAPLAKLRGSRPPPPSAGHLHPAGALLLQRHLRIRHLKEMFSLHSRGNRRNSDQLGLWFSLIFSFQTIGIPPLRSWSTFGCSSHPHKIWNTLWNVTRTNFFIQKSFQGLRWLVFIQIHRGLEPDCCPDALGR